MTTATTPIAEKVAAHAAQLGIDDKRIRQYQVDLSWMLDHGTLVNVHVYGINLFTSRATMAELGIQTGDIRASRLRPGQRELIAAHPTAHYYHLGQTSVYLGFRPDLPPPPAFYFRKANRVIGLDILAGPDKWQPVELPDREESSRWLTLPELPGWQPCLFREKEVRWLRIRTQPARKPLTPDDLLCNPATALRSIETRARASVDMRQGGFGQRFPGFGGFAWIGFKAWQPWREQWQRLEAELNAIKSYILWRYDEFADVLGQDFEAMALESWRAMLGRRRKMAVAVGNGTDPIETEADFCDFIVAEALGRIPSREKIIGQVRIDFMVSVALGQAEVQADLLEAELLRTERLKETEAQRLIRAESDAQERVIWRKERLAEAEIQVQHERLNAERQAMKEAALARARQQMSEMASPYQAMLDNLRAVMFQEAQQIAASMKQHGRLHSSVAERARNLVEYCRAMNSHDDTELEALLDLLNTRLPTRGGSKSMASNAAIQETLNEIVKLTEASARAVGQADYGFEFLEL